MIYKREEYVEEAGEGAKFPVKHIEVFTPQEGGKPRFVGEVVLGLETPMGIQQIPISFQIEAEVVAEAFQKFEQYALPKIEQARREIEEEVRRVRREASGRIITPGKMGQGDLIDFNKLKG
jgi:hypothetical protein